VLLFGVGSVVCLPEAHEVPLTVQLSVSTADPLFSDCSVSALCVFVCVRARLRPTIEAFLYCSYVQHLHGVQHGELFVSPDCVISEKKNPTVFDEIWQLSLALQVVSAVSFGFCHIGIILFQEL